MVKLDSEKLRPLMTTKQIRRCDIQKELREVGCVADAHVVLVTKGLNSVF